MKCGPETVKGSPIESFQEPASLPIEGVSGCLRRIRISGLQRSVNCADPAQPFPRTASQPSVVTAASRVEIITAAAMMPVSAR